MMNRKELWQKEIEIAGLALLVLFTAYPITARAVTSGGGYSVQEQISIFGALLSGGGFGVDSSGQSQGGAVSGGGFSITGGVLSAPPAPAPSPAPSVSPRGDPGGGGVLLGQYFFPPSKLILLPTAGLVTVLKPPIAEPGAVPSVEPGIEVIQPTPEKPVSLFDVSVEIAETTKPPLWRRIAGIFSNAVIWLFSWWRLWLVVIVLVLIWRKIKKLRR